MTKEEWVLELKWLEKLEKNFENSDLAGYMEHKDLYKEHVVETPELYFLITGKDGTSSGARSFKFDDFLQHGHQKFDLKELKAAIISKIDAL